MLSWIREKFGKAVIGAIISLIAFVFIFYGVFSPKSTRGLHEGAVAGTVNGDSISISEFSRELNHRIEFYRKMGGGKLSEEQLQAFQVRQTVFQELANRKMMLQEGKRRNLVASDEEVKEKIREIPSFQKDGGFDVATYRKVLESNRYSPGGFERLVREDASVRKWEQYFKDRIQVTEGEIRNEFKLMEDQRNLKYVLIDRDAIKKTIPVAEEEIKKYLEDKAKLNLVQMRFNAKKDSEYKGKTFDSMKNQIAKDLIAGDQVGEIQKKIQDLSESVLKVLNEGQGSESKLASLLKPYSLTVKSTGKFSRQSAFVPGLGENKEIMKDAFSKSSVIDPKSGGKAKKYLLNDRAAVVWVTDSRSADFSKLEAKRAHILMQVSNRKMRNVYESWMKALVERSKIDINSEVVNSEKI